MSDTNEPTGPAESRTFDAIPAGWFVCTPKGGWLEITATRSLRPGVQEVSMRMPDGAIGTWERNTVVKVPCRRGTRVTEVSDAVDALGDGAVILEDSL